MTEENARSTAPVRAVVNRRFLVCLSDAIRQLCCIALLFAFLEVRRG